ncbi:MAG TPA: hypothetical protein VME22_18695 [Solirubrobacteraceae bacterium]|nr:hypothetical protein [Solirubrobacteraceae bacterium]
MIRQHHPIKTAVALSAITAGLLVAGCGGSSSSNKGGGVSTVRAAYVSSSVAGYQIAMKVTGSAAGRTLNVTGTGTFDQASHAGQLTMNLNPPTVGGENLQINEVILGTDFYLKLPASLASKIPGGKPWLELNLSDIGKSGGMQGLSSLAGDPGDNPAHFLQFVHAASTGSVQNLGQQTVDGVSTTGWRATIDLSKVVDTLPASQRSSASSAIASMEKLTGLHYLPIDAWVDSSDHARRIVVSATGNVEGQPFSEDIQVDFVKYGLEPVPAVPPANEVTNIMSLPGAP